MKYYCSYISKDYKNDWEEIVKNNNSSGFHQSFGWARFKQTQNWDTYKIGIFDKNTKKLVGGAVILKFSFSNGTNFFYIPEGPVLDFNNLKQWNIFKKELYSIIGLKTTHIRIEPKIKSIEETEIKNYEKAPINLLPKYTRIINLYQSIDHILSQMKAKCRYNIRLSKRKGVIVKETGKISDFFKIYEITCKRKGFKGKNINYFRNLHKSLKDNLKIFTASYKGQILASSIIIYFGNKVTYLYGASTNELRNYMAPYLLHYYIFKDAKLKGYSIYDFWGIAKDDTDKNHKWYGFTKFKKQFGGEKLGFCGAYDKVFNQKLYNDFIKKHES